jgi:hypothetical protein
MLTLMGSPGAIPGNEASTSAARAESLTLPKVSM